MSTYYASSTESASLELEAFVMLGQLELMMRGSRRPDTTDVDIKEINEAIKVYVEKRTELDSDRSLAQWHLVTDSQNAVIHTLQRLHNVRIVHGHALWDMPIMETVRESDASTNTKDVQSTALNGQQAPSAMPSNTLPQLMPEDPELSSSDLSSLTFSLPEGRKRMTEDDLWEKVLSYLPPLKQPSVEWLTKLRDLVADLDPANRDKAAAKLGPELWSQLVFLNVHRCRSRTLAKTKVLKTKISSWDLIPTEAEAPCRACGDKIPCQWTNSKDRFKCRECRLQGRCCTFSGDDNKQKGEKRKRGSEPLETAPIRVWEDATHVYTTRTCKTSNGTVYLKTQIRPLPSPIVPDI